MSNDETMAHVAEVRQAVQAAAGIERREREALGVLYPVKQMVIFLVCAVFLLGVVAFGWAALFWLYRQVAEALS